jgi:hypothetical protein
MELLIILVWLQVKHWVIDFVMQTPEQVHGKGIYGNLVGISHSLEHVLGTVLALMLASYYLSGLGATEILLFALIDGVLHYHIDWAKMNWGNRDITTPQFWSHLGLDQMAHQICYLFLVAMFY